MHERISVQFRRFFDELLVQFLSSALLSGEPADAVFATLGEPSRRERCQAAKRGSSKSGKSRKIGKAHVATVGAVALIASMRSFGYQAGAALPREIAPQPLRPDAHAILSLRQRNKMNKCPGQPSQESTHSDR